MFQNFFSVTESTSYPLQLNVVETSWNSLILKLEAAPVGLIVYIYIYTYICIHKVSGQTPPVTSAAPQLPRASALLVSSGRVPIELCPYCADGHLHRFQSSSTSTRDFVSVHCTCSAKFLFGTTLFQCPCLHWFLRLLDHLYLYWLSLTLDLQIINWIIGATSPLWLGTIWLCLPLQLSFTPSNIIVHPVGCIDLALCGILRSISI